MLAFLRFPQIKGGSSSNNCLSVLDKFLKNRFEGQGLGNAIHKRDHIEMECLLKLGVFVEIVEHFLRLGALFELHDNTDIFC